MLAIFDNLRDVSFFPLPCVCSWLCCAAASSESSGHTNGGRPDFGHIS